jgi:hypothetical protein
MKPLEESVFSSQAAGAADDTPDDDPPIGLKGRWCVGREFNVLALIKGEERYIYVYDDASRAPLLEAFRCQADDPNLSLNWFDAAVLTQKAHEQAASAPHLSRF